MPCQELSLSECRWVNDAVAASLLRAMAVDGRLLRLERLGFSWTSITDETFVAVGQLAGRSLRIMEARGCSLLGRKTITDVGTAVLNAPALCARLAHARVGEEEACRGCPGAPEAATRAWAGVCALAAACGGLEALDLYDYHGCSDASAQALAVGCARLRVLKLPCCHAISDHGLVVAGSGWATSLRTLDVSYNGHVDDGSLARALAHLAHLPPPPLCVRLQEDYRRGTAPPACKHKRACTHTHTRRARARKRLPGLLVPSSAVWARWLLVEVRLGTVPSAQILRKAQT